MHGQGAYTFGKGELEGHKYVGNLKDNKKHGQGTYTVANGAKYVGEWKGDKRHGQGTYVEANGAKYVGEWKGDKKHGQGTVTWPNGAKYVGEWKAGWPWEGVEYLASGEIAGTYTNGKADWE